MTSSRESTSTLLQAVAELARVTGDVAAAHFQRLRSVDWKADGSPVTDADRAAEQAARQWLERRFPEDGIVGEEFGVTRPGARRRWFLDPIDGTRTFVAGVPLYGSLIAVVQGDTQVLAGSAYFPSLDEIVCAAQGESCWWNDRVTNVSQTASISEAVVLCTDERISNDEQQRAGWRRLAGAAQTARTWGDCYGYLLVATGRAEVMTDGVLSPWDAAAIQPIIEEAGGVFTDWAGNRTAFGGSAIATNALLADEARQLLRAGPAHSGQLC